MFYFGCNFIETDTHQAPDFTWTEVVAIAIEWQLEYFNGGSTHNQADVREC